MVILLLAGAGGGLIRGLMGLLKYHLAYKEVKFKPLYFLGMVVLSAFVGLTVTWAIVGSGINFPFVAQINPALAFIIGYAGGDFIENLYKIFLKQTTLFPVS